MIETNACDAVVWAGELNADYSRKTAHARLVKESMEDMNMTSAWEKFDMDFTCVSEVGGITRISVLGLNFEYTIEYNPLPSGIPSGVALGNRVSLVSSYCEYSITDCRDLQCKNHKHMEESDKLMEKVLYMVQEVTKKCLPWPKVHKGKVKVLFGWNESVKPLRDIAYFWNQVWQLAKRHLNTRLHQMIKKIHNIYHMLA